MNKEWNAVFDFYVNKIISPDGRDTFESNTELVRHIIDMVKLDNRYGEN